jgi:hypothetical protein
LGDFKVKTKNPILVAGNIFDAHTPLKSALNITVGFEGSGLLVVNGTGVGSFSLVLLSLAQVLMLLCSTLLSARLPSVPLQR